MQNNFIYSDRGEGKTEFITKLANELYRKGKFNIDFFSLTTETLPKLDRGIKYSIFSDNIMNRDHIIMLEKEKIKNKKLDIIFIDDINYLGDWGEILQLKCDKFITIDIMDNRISSRFEKKINEIEYNLFHLSEVQYNNFLKEYMRDKKIKDILS